MVTQSKITPATHSLRPAVEVGKGCIFMNIGGPNDAIRTLSP